MERIIIPISREDKILIFEVLDFAHNEDHQCKFELLLGDQMVASFEPDRQGFLHICKNPGGIDRETLHLIAEKIEGYNFH